MIGVSALLMFALVTVPNGTGQQGRPQQKDGVLVGEQAPAFKLDYIREERQFDLSAKFGKRPIVIVFGSYT